MTEAAGWFVAAVFGVLVFELCRVIERQRIQIKIMRHLLEQQGMFRQVDKEREHGKLQL